jgi:hypothetical protein
MRRETAQRESNSARPRDIIRTTRLGSTGVMEIKTITEISGKWSWWGWEVMVATPVGK